MDRAGFLKWLGATIGGRFVPGDRWRTSAEEIALDASSTLPERRLGRTGVTLPILGLGGWHLGDAGSEGAARDLVETALAEGIRFFDTAESYQAGMSERWLGRRSRRWVRDNRPSS